MSSHLNRDVKVTPVDMFVCWITCYMGKYDRNMQICKYVNTIQNKNIFPICFTSLNLHSHLTTCLVSHLATLKIYSLSILIHPHTRACHPSSKCNQPYKYPPISGNENRRATPCDGLIDPYRDLDWRPGRPWCQAWLEHCSWKPACSVSSEDVGQRLTLLR